ncbi:MAG: hypothetical protein OXG53_17590 [Chloroflexi bacterium]|nr:hypothetical protein [Chloroflexota bacterium]
MKHLTIVVTAIWLLIACDVSLAFDRGAATAIAWSPDGETIAVASTNGLWLFDTEFNEIGYVPSPELDAYPPSTMDWHANGKWIAISNHNFKKRYDRERSRKTGFPILVIDVAQRKVVSTIQFPRLSTEIRWHPEDRLILGGEYDGTVKIVDAFSGEFQFTYRKSRAPAYHEYNRPIALCWISDNLVSIVTRDTVYVVDHASKATVHLISIDKTGLSLGFEAADCHRSGKIITDLGYFIDALGATKDRIFSLDKTFTFKDYWYDEWDIVDIRWSPDASQIATNGNAGLCRTAIFDGDSFTLQAELQGSHARTYGRYHDDSIAWHPDGGRFAIVGKLDIRVWDANTYKLLTIFEGFDKLNPVPRISSADTTEEEPSIDPRTRGVHCPSLPDSHEEAAELRLAAFASRLPS